MSETTVGFLVGCILLVCLALAAIIAVGYTSSICFMYAHRIATSLRQTRSTNTVHES